MNIPVLPLEVFGGIGVKFEDRCLEIGVVSTSSGHSQVELANKGIHVFGEEILKFLEAVFSRRIRTQNGWKTNTCWHES